MCRYVITKIEEFTNEQKEDNNDDIIKCPNNCFDGKVKYYSDDSKALYDLVKCHVCKGKGELTKKEYDRKTKQI